MIKRFVNRFIRKLLINFSSDYFDEDILQLRDLSRDSPDRDILFFHQTMMMSVIQDEGMSQPVVKHNQRHSIKNNTKKPQILMKKE